MRDHVYYSVQVSGRMEVSGVGCQVSAGVGLSYEAGRIGPGAAQIEGLEVRKEVRGRFSGWLPERPV